MLENSRPTFPSQSFPSFSNNSSFNFMLQGLCKEIEQHKSQLAHALSINSILVHQVMAYRPTQASPSDDLNLQHRIKLEENQESESESPTPQQLIRKTLRKIRGDDEDHDKNETKNIPKNYGKAILSFIQKNVQRYNSIIKPILQKGKLSIGDLLSHIKKHKKEVNSINYLKEMWGYYDRTNPILKCIRILSYVFMRKHCLSYIFNSRVKNYSTHIKYRTRVIEGIEHPEQFTCIKQF